MDSYTISYTFRVTGCDGVSGSAGTRNVVGIDGATRMYTLSGLEEFTEYNITVTAVNEVGSISSSRSIILTSAGK